MRKNKAPDHLPFTTAEFRKTLSFVWTAFQQLAVEDVFASCSVEEVRFSTRPGLMSTFQHLNTPFGKIRLFHGTGLEIEFTPKKGDTIIVHLPTSGFIDSCTIIERLMTKTKLDAHRDPPINLGRSRNPLKQLGTAISALDVHLEQEIISIENDRALIGFPDMVDPVSLSTIATMLHMLVLSTGEHLRYGPDMAHKACSEVSAPFMMEGLTQDTWSCCNRCDHTVSAKLLERFDFTIKPRITVRASRPRWRGVKEPVYHWRLAFEADKATTCDRLNWLDKPANLDPAEVERAQALAAELGFTLAPADYPLAA